ncbi:hypothetical protein EMEDMD4_1060004 [Sinorhizobium medicae]|uniref:NADP-dependent oxidoreductase domain-containing protein n=1 Tax=Sinorhizobium medicae TaxID=110321 RepID=A0A508WPU0_9HYPH|nr:hypothetical protein EMEDMD4_1060004 [Sinorhizobium medicae]
MPRTGERVTTLGLGTFLTFDLKPGDRRDALRQVFERYVAAGGRVVDTSPLYGSAEVSVGQFMGESEGSEEMFLANKVWATGEYLGDESHAGESFRQSRMRTWRDTINLMIALKTCAGNSRYLLPSRYDADAPMSRATFNRITYAVVDLAQKEGLPLEPFTVHDLRRTGSTLLNELGLTATGSRNALTRGRAIFARRLQQGGIRGSAPPYAPGMVGRR